MMGPVRKFFTERFTKIRFGRARGRGVPFFEFFFNDLYCSASFTPERKKKYTHMRSVRVTYLKNDLNSFVFYRRLFGYGSSGQKEYIFRY